MLSINYPQRVLKRRRFIIKQNNPLNVALSNKLLSILLSENQIFVQYSCFQQFSI